jgi:hypothetical protein
MARAQQAPTTTRNHDEPDSDSVTVVATSSAKKAKTAGGSAAAAGGKGSSKKQQENVKTGAITASTSTSKVASSKPKLKKPKEPSFDSDSECPACAAIPPEKRKKAGKSPEAEDWIACDECAVVSVPIDDHRC